MTERRSRRVPPHDAAAEEALLGSLMLRMENMEHTHSAIDSSDFYTPSNATIYSVLYDLWSSGVNRCDAVVVADALKEQGALGAVGGTSKLVSLVANAPGTSLGQIRRWCEIILRTSTYRSAIRVGLELVDSAYSMSGDPNDLVDDARGALESIEVHLGEIPSDAWVLDEYLARPMEDRPQWCIDGLVRDGWRVIIVASEGVGKTILLRAMAIAAAQGIHPLDFRRIEPCRSLIVDLENPDDSVMDTCTPINDRTKRTVGDGYDPDRAWLWHRPAGINLRKRSDRIALETVISRVRPRLVCLGPLYKAYEVSANENDEQAAREVMAVLDDLRTRYSFALVMEHHAPKESSGAKRKMMPYGSSLWLRWPEMGISLNPVDETNQEMIVGRWRGDRLPNQWPRKIVRGGQWEWTGVWEDGHFNNEPPPKKREPRPPRNEGPDELGQEPF